MVDESNKQYREFLNIVGELMSTPEVRRLHNLSHHYNTTRFQHSLNVAYYSYLVVKKLGLDYVSAARGGLLHDLFYYECKNSSLGMFKHAAVHPKIALKNAEKICSLNKTERDIIQNHMFLAGFAVPKSREAFIVSFIDKYCATYEALYSTAAMIKFKIVQSTSY